MPVPSPSLLTQFSGQPLLRATGQNMIDGYQTKLNYKAPWEWQHCTIFSTPNCSFGSLSMLFKWERSIKLSDALLLVNVGSLEMWSVWNSSETLSVSALRDSKVLNECVESEVLARHLCCENCILRPADLGPATSHFLIKGNSLTQKYS